MIHAALDLIDTDGVEALSMRKLGQVLGRDPMRLYSHTESKAALLNSVAELVLEGLGVPSTSGGDWESGLRSAAKSFRQIAIDHPRMVPFLLTRPLDLAPAVLPTSSLSWTEGLLGLLAEAGFDQAGALHAYRFFTGFLIGHMLHAVQDLNNDSGASAVFPRLGVDLLADKRYPHIHALGPVVAENGELELILGLDMVLTGLKRQLSAITDTDKRQK